MEDPYPEVNLTPGAKWIKNIVKDRLGQFTGGRWGSLNLPGKLFTHREDGECFVEMEVWSAPGLSKPSFQEAIKQTYKPAKKGQSFGPSWSNHWWKVHVTIPTEWAKYERVQFEFDPGCEAMIFSIDGVPLQGITGGYGGDRRVEHLIPLHAVKKGKYSFVIESTCNGMFGVPWDGDTISPPDMNRQFSLASADLVVPNMEAWHLLWDFTTIKEMINVLPGNSILQNKALVVANEIMNVFTTLDDGGIKTARKLAEEIFGEGWQAKGAGVYKEGPEKIDIWGIGYCHIDTAWLWPYSATQQKIARSWSTQVDLMERYPEHRFCCSSAQQFKWLEQLYPPLFERVKSKVLSGQFQPIGGSWVENDGNMPSGEALIRQSVFGQRYFQSRFGKKCDTAWLPDSFGYTGSLPQIVRSAGMKYFFTQKLSWNNINKFPHSTFNWSGIDGTQVLCHMTPVDTYTAQATVGDVVKGITNHKNLESNDSALLVFGNGDGGGGPLAHMLENLRRIRAASNNHRDLPTVHMGKSADEFFQDVEKSTKEGKTLPTWHGELYFELHRGTYTSQARTKQGNRRSERLMRDVEFVATLASLIPSTNFNYPHEKINDQWEKVLLNQFHDVLPGSAIGMVYEDAAKLYGEVAKAGKEILDDAFSKILEGSSELVESNGHSDNNEWVVAFNTTPFPRTEIIGIPIDCCSAAFKPQLVQLSADKTKGYFVAKAEGSGPAYPSSTHVALDGPGVIASTNSSGDIWLRNSNVQLTISGGRITSLYDEVAGRELIPKGSSGGLTIYDDKPLYWDAWDVEVYHLETRRSLEFENVKVVSSGPLIAVVEAEVTLPKSKIKVTISLSSLPSTHHPDARSYFTFDAEVDWHERHQILKFEVPLNIHSDYATYESQFGWVQRPTHKNTTWDIAKFEVCGHKFADLSEYGYGVAILSESKYGFSCEGNILRMSLLRAATAPDAEQDQGHHEFSWALLPHVGHFIQSNVPQAAYLFNSPLHLRSVSKSNIGPTSYRPTFNVRNAPNVILETVKRGDDDETTGSKTIIVRLYEAFGGHATANLDIVDDLCVQKAYLANVLEENTDELEITSTGQDDIPYSSVELNFRGFEFKTVKFVITAENESSNRSSWVKVTQEMLGV